VAGAILGAGAVVTAVLLIAPGAAGPGAGGARAAAALVAVARGRRAPVQGMLYGSAVPVERLGPGGPDVRDAVWPVAEGGAPSVATDRIGA